MAPVHPPTPDKVRVLLTDPKVTPAELDRIGDLFLLDERPSIAVMFYDRTRTPDRVKGICDRAIRDGDAFLMDWVAKVNPDLATAEAWKRCAEAAAAQGKIAFARTGFVRAGDPERAAGLKG